MTLGGNTIHNNHGVISLWNGPVYYNFISLGNGPVHYTVEGASNLVRPLSAARPQDPANAHQRGEQRRGPGM
jgi:hypothetical protein